MTLDGKRCGHINSAAPSHRVAPSQQSVVQGGKTSGRATMTTTVSGESKSPTLLINVQRAIVCILSRGEASISVASDRPTPAQPAGDVSAKARSKTTKLVVLPAR